MSSLSITLPSLLSISTSPVTLLSFLTESGQPEETGPGAEGWVEVLENSISYGFDITRVMFCSGNCTERIRMGKEVRTSV